MRERRSDFVYTLNTNRLGWRAAVPRRKRIENISCLLACRCDGVPDGRTAVRGLKYGIHGIPNQTF